MPCLIQIHQVLTTALLQWAHEATDVAWRLLVGAWAFALFLLKHKYFPYVATSLAAIFLFSRTRRAYRKWNEGWLSGLIEKKLQETRRRHTQAPRPGIRGPRDVYRAGRVGLFRLIRAVGRYALYEARADIKTLYLPSFTSSLAVVVFVAVFFVLPRFPVFTSSLMNPVTWWTTLLADLDADRLETVAKVFEGVDLIAIALIIFVAESMRDDKNLDQRRVLLKISYLWPLALVITLSPFAFLWSKLTGFFIILEIAIAIFAIYALARMISNLINVDTREDDRRNLLKDRIRKIIQGSVRERIGNNILSAKLGSDKEIKLESTLSKKWVDGGLKNYILVEAPQEGWISDINLVELQDLVEFLESQAQRFGFSLYQAPGPALEGATEEDDDVFKDTSRLSNPPKKAYLLKKFGDLLPSNSIFNADGGALLALPKEFAGNKGVIEEVQARVAQIFRFSTVSPPAVAFRQELKGTKDELIAAIRSASLGAIEDLRQTYLQVAEEFLKMLHELGGGYSVEQADNERNNMFSEGWDEIRWLQKDIRELLVAAAETDNDDIIADIAYLPVAIATRALTVRDHLLFREFLTYTTFLYHLASKKPADSSIRKFMTDRAWRYPKEVADYHLRPYFADNDDEYLPASYTDLKDFGLYIFKIFLQLLKGTVDNKDAAAFSKFLEEFSKMAKRLLPDDNSLDSDTLKIMLEGIRTDAERATLQARLDKQIEKEGASKALQTARGEVVFGIAAWVLDQFLDSDDDAVLLQMLRKIETELPTTLKRLTEIFGDEENHSAARRWGWDWWDLVPDGEARFVDTFTRPNNFYCFRALQILGGMTPEDIARANLPPAPAIRSMTREGSGRSLLATLDQIRATTARWLRVLTQAQIDKIDALQEILLRAKVAEEQAEEERLRNSGVDPGILSDFKKQVLHTYTKGGRVKKLMIKLGVFNDRLDTKPGNTIPSWGFNQLDDKAAFIKDWPVGYAGWGTSYGSGLAQSEDQISFSKMVEGAGTQKNVTRATLLSEIEQAVREGGFKKPIIVQSLVSSIEYQEIRRNELFIPKYHNDCPKTDISDLDGFLGVLKCGTKIVPVFDILARGRDLKNRVLVADLERLAHMDQYSPVEEPDEDMHLFGPLSVKVIDLNADDAMRAKILSEDPAWLAEKSDKEGYLKSRVVIKVYEKFKVEIDDAAAGICLTVAQEDQSPADQDD